MCDLSTKTWTQLQCKNSSEAISGSGYSVICKEAELYFIGSRLHEIKILNLRDLTWRTEMLQSKPSQGLPQNRSSSCVTPFNSKVIIYGGIDEEGRTLNDLWSLCLETKEWTKISTLEPRSGHSGMQINQSIAFIGGRSYPQGGLSG